MASETDAGRDIKLTLSMVAGAVVVILGGAYFLWSWLSAPPPTNSRLEIGRVTGSTQGKSPESSEYRSLLHIYNQKGGAEAQQANRSFVASIPMEQEPLPLPVSTAKPAPSKASTARQSRSDSSAASTNTAPRDDKRQAVFEALLARLQPPVEAKKDIAELQVAQVLGGASGVGGEGGSDYQRWSESLPGGARVPMASMSATGAGQLSSMGSPVEIVPPYWRGPGVIDIGVDSDNSTTPVLGSLPTGQFSGAKLKAPDGAKLTGEGVVIHFTEMAFKGVNYKVDAYALHDETLLANVATTVNNRYLSRIVLPALLSGIGGVGEMYSQANTQVVSNGFNSQTVRPGVPDATAVVGAIAGGAASQAAKVLSEDAGRTPAKQVMVTKGQVIAIQFMRGVYAGDAIAPGQGGEAVRPSTPALGTTLPQASTADDWRAQTRLRIEEQRRLQEVKR